MGCNCGKGRRSKVLKCGLCGKVTTTGSSEYKRFWIRNPKSIDETKFICGNCAVKNKYKKPGRGKITTQLYQDTIKETIEISKMKKE